MPSEFFQRKLKNIQKIAGINLKLRKYVRHKKALILPVARSGI